MIFFFLVFERFGLKFWVKFGARLVNKANGNFRNISRDVCLILSIE